MKTVSYLITLLVGMAATADTPPMPYRDVGACPFECCHYGAWTAGKPATARKADDSKSAIAFQIKPGERITALTGIVITRKPGAIRMLKTYQSDKFIVPAGTLLYTLHNGGEGTTLFWFDGKARWADLYAESVHKGNSDYPWDVLSIPEAEWWVKVQTQDGAVGWILSPQDFKGMDSCGG